MKQLEHRIYTVTILLIFNIRNLWIYMVSANAIKKSSKI